MKPSDRSADRPALRGRATSSICASVSRPRRPVRSAPLKRLSLIMLGLVSCAGEEVAPFEVPEPLPIGFQLYLRPITILPGDDIEFCTYFNLDTPEQLAMEGNPFLLEDLVVNAIDPSAQEIAVNRIDVRGAAGLHHIQILAIEKDLEDVEDKYIFEC